MIRAHRGRALLTAATMASAFASAQVAYAYVDTNINFNDSTGLFWVYGQARTTFATPSTDNGSGHPVTCTGGEPAGCWQYAQPTYDLSGNFYWFYVYDWNSASGTGASHYHLFFENWAMGECFYDPGDGQGSGYSILTNGVCQPVDWSTAARFLSPHGADDWIQTWPDAWREFRPSAMFNHSSVPIQIWVLAIDGNWYVADNLSGPSDKQNLYDIASNSPVWEVDVGVASSYTGGSPFEIDNFYISYP